MNRTITLALLGALALTPRHLEGQGRGVPASADATGAGALGEALAALPVNGRVLLIGAHPDDEDNRLVAWMSRGKHYEVAYLSLTRGDGGQNIIGNELGEALGAIRTEELLAARRVDGAWQYFTRAYDFGFSKNADEAFRHWPHDSVLGDVVRVVRAFKPQVIIAVFSGTPRDGHGQHQVSGIVAREAFDAALDTVKFPAARYGAAWTPLKFYRNRSYWGNEGATYTYQPSAWDPLLGRSYVEVAAISRDQHRSQAQGTLENKGPVTGSLRLEASRVSAVADAAAERSIFTGIDSTVTRLRAAVRPADRARVDALAATLAAVPRGADLARPATVLPALARASALLRTIAAGMAPGATLEGLLNGDLPDDDRTYSLLSLHERLSRAAMLATGLAVEATVPREEMVVGRDVPVRVAVYARGGQPLVAHASVVGHDVVPAVSGGQPVTLRVPADSAATATITVRAGRITQPFWLAAPRTSDLYPAGPASAAGAPAAEVRLVVDAGADLPALEIAAPVTWRHVDRVLGELNPPMAVVPALSVTMEPAVQYARAGTAIERTVNVAIRSADTTARAATVSLELPAGLTADSATRTVALGGYGTVRTVSFAVRGRLAAGRQVIRAVVASNGERFTRGYQLVDYPHIRAQRLYRDAEVAIEAIDVTLPARTTMAYIQGAADNSAPALRQLGFDVTMLDPERLGATDLSRFASIVVGPRAYETTPALVRQNAALLDWVKRGGTLVVQYGQGEMQQPGLMPYPITLARPVADRVTDEASPVRFADPGAGVLRLPNAITPRDFEGWIQDRTLYMPRTHAPEYAAPLLTSDPGEPLNDGAILVAPWGQGTYVYTTLAFFRQLPAGVPGAARLFVNLMAAQATSNAPRAAGSNP